MANLSVKPDVARQIPYLQHPFIHWPLDYPKDILEAAINACQFDAFWATFLN